jgi:hypothetical protein
MLAVGVLFDYFAAGSDSEAGSVIDRVGGPGSPAAQISPPTPAGKRRWFGRKPSSPRPSITSDPGLVIFDTVSVKGIDPLVQLGTLEELLTGRPYDEVVEDPRAGQIVESRHGGERLVCTLTDSLTTALARASDEELHRVAQPWAQTEEFWGGADPGGLAEFLVELAGLARRAQANGRRLYCWVCV